MKPLHNRKPSAETIADLVKHCASFSKEELEALTYDEVESIDAVDINWCYEVDEIDRAREYGRTGSDEAITTSLVSSALFGEYEYIVENK
ncbi:MAG: hypothetical protein ABGY43_10120 [bacterium]|jgi:hypothetical protein